MPTYLTILALSALAIGILLTLRGPDWISAEKPEITTETIRGGFGAGFNVLLLSDEKITGNIVADGSVDVRVELGSETLLYLRNHTGNFEVASRSFYESTYEISVENGLDPGSRSLDQGDVTYTLTLQKFKQEPFVFRFGNVILFSGLIAFVATLIRPGRIVNRQGLFLRMKLLETTIRIVAVCLAYVGTIILEITIVGNQVFSPQIIDETVLLPVSQIESQQASAAALSLHFILLAIFPLAVGAYFIAPNRIRKEWRLANAVRDHTLETICYDLSKKIGLKSPPSVYITNSAEGAICFGFGNSVRNYTIVLTSRVKEILSVPELRALMIHELSHALHKDIAFITWGQVYLKLIRYWIIAVILTAAAILLLSPPRIQDALLGGFLFTAALYAASIIYSFFIINAVSRDRELSADLNSVMYEDGDYLKSALIKMKKESLDKYAGNRLLFYSALENKLSGFKGKIRKMFILTHPTLDRRINTIEGRHTKDIFASNNIINIGLVAGFPLLFFIAFIGKLAPEAISGVFLLLAPIGITIGIFYAIYFTYFNVSNSLSLSIQGTDGKSAAKVFASGLVAPSILAVFSIVLGIRPPDVDDTTILWFYPAVIFLVGAITFVFAYPASLILQKIFRRIFV